MQFNFGYATDIGRRRQQNQDSLAVAPELGLFVVADGMGGHKGGETASSMAVHLIPEEIRQKKALPAWKAKGAAFARTALAQAIENASVAIFDRSSREISLQGMGTTATALLFVESEAGPELLIGHVGDSRCYLIQDGCIWQLTRDHSLVQEKLRAGLISREELKTDRMRNVITRSVGFEARISVDIYEVQVQPGDIFLVCSDGLSGLVDDQSIRRIVNQELTEGSTGQGPSGIQRAVTSLISAANARGGDDNITAVLIEIPPKT